MSVRDVVWIVVVHTPPLEGQSGFVASALRIADVAIVFMNLTLEEYKHLPEVWSVIDDVDSLRTSPH
jgi:hypothetical protein